MLMMASLLENVFTDGETESEKTGAAKTDSDETIPSTATASDFSGSWIDSVSQRSTPMGKITLSVGTIEVVIFFEIEIL
jgi:hypothetical protein